MDIIVKHLLKELERSFKALDEARFEDTLVSLYDALGDDVAPEPVSTPIADRFDKSKLAKKTNTRISKNLEELDADTVLEIVKLVKSREYTQASIAQAFHIPPGLVTAIVNGRKYQDITGLPTVPVKKIGKRGKRNAKA